MGEEKAHGLLVAALAEFAAVFNVPPPGAAAGLGAGFVPGKAVVFYVGRHEGGWFSSWPESWLGLVGGVGVFRRLG